jgi:hypothetical protein
MRILFTIALLFVIPFTTVAANIAQEKKMCNSIKHVTSSKDNGTINWKSKGVITTTENKVDWKRMSPICKRVMESYPNEPLYIYIYGKTLGYSGNPEKGFKYYKIAAENNVPEGQYALGYCYYNGYGKIKPKDTKIVVNWLQKSIKQKYQPAKNLYNTLKSRNFLSAKEWRAKEAKEKKIDVLGMQIKKAKEDFEAWERKKCIGLFPKQTVRLEGMPSLFGTTTEVLYIINIDRQNHKVLVEDIYGTQSISDCSTLN